MKKLIILYIFFIIIACKKEEKIQPPPEPQIPTSNVTSFQKTFATVTMRDVIQCSDNSFILTGGINNDVLLMRMDTAANVQWSKSFDGISNDQGFSVRQTTDGGFIIAGWTNGFNGNSMDAYLIKTDASGNLQWSQSFGGDSLDNFYCVRQTTDGGYMVVGNTNSLGAIKPYLIKTNSNGNLQWSKAYGGIYNAQLFSLEQTTDGGFILTGLIDSISLIYEDIYLLKIDSVGNPQWSKTYGGSDQEWGICVLQTIDGGFIIGGSTTSFGAGSVDGYLLKTDITGNLQWSKAFGGIGVDYLNSLRQTVDGGYILCGQTSCFSANGTDDAYLIKTDGSGNLQWSKTFGDAVNNNAAIKVWQSNNGGYIMAAGNDIIKTDANGISGCREQLVNTIVTVPSTIVTSINSGVTAGLPVIVIATNTIIPTMTDSIICIQ